MVKAYVIPTKDGLHIKFSVTGDMETKVRRMMNNIRDDGDVSSAMSHLLNISMSAVSMIKENKEKVF